MNTQQRIFAEAYLGQAKFSPTNAAKIAGYAHPSVAGSRLLTHPEVAALVSKRIEEEVMDANEVLERLSEQARSEYALYINDDGTVNLPQMKADGKAHLIKKIRPTRYGTEIEFYDGQSALLAIGKHHKLFVDRTEVTGEVTYTEHESAAQRIEGRLASLAARIGTSETAQRNSPDAA